MNIKRLCALVSVLLVTASTHSFSQIFESPSGDSSSYRKKLIQGNRLSVQYKNLFGVDAIGIGYLYDLGANWMLRGVANYHFSSQFKTDIQVVDRFSTTPLGTREVNSNLSAYLEVMVPVYRYNNFLAIVSVGPAMTGLDINFSSQNDFKPNNEFGATLSAQGFYALSEDFAANAGLRFSQLSDFEPLGYEVGIVFVW